MAAHGGLEFPALAIHDRGEFDPDRVTPFLLDADLEGEFFALLEDDRLNIGFDRLGFEGRRPNLNAR
jgi:hypothetical protein